MGVVVKRDYRSAVRAEQASATRRAIVVAASRLFIENGFGATTIDSVAKAAGVSRKTVFTAVGGKVDLLKLALDWAVAGDDLPVALADRNTLRELLEQPDPAVLLTGWARLQAEIGARAAALVQALEVAAETDAEARGLLTQVQEQRLDDASKIVKRVRKLGALAADLTVREAVDLAWLATDAALFDRLVRVREWTTDRFAQWLGENLCRQLLDG
jgi:AcrR family transcriptional regulator